MDDQTEFPMTVQCPKCGSGYTSDVRFCPLDGSPLVTRGAPASVIGTLLGGRYRVERLIGSGGMGVVYQVRHLRLDEIRALKLMQGTALTNPMMVERFRREARQQGRIRHPNVATLYDFDEEPDGSCFLVMEYVEGGSLGELLRTTGAVSPARVASLVSQIAAALDAAHEAGVVHRDLKPDNVLLAVGRDGTDRVKVVDFGIATLMNDSVPGLTSTGMAIGTPRYMSPEQLFPVSGEPVDGRSDTYTLGLLTLEMLCGELPVGGKDVSDVMRRASSAPPNVSTLQVGVSLPPSLDPVFTRVLAVERTDRYETAGQFAKEFVAVMASAGLSPQPAQLPHPTPFDAGPTIPSGDVAATAAPVARPAIRKYAVGGTAVLAVVLIVAVFLSNAWNNAGIQDSLDVRDSTTGDASARPDSVPPSQPVTQAATNPQETTPDVPPKPPAAQSVSLFDVEQWPEIESAQGARRRIQDLNAVLSTLRISEDSIGAELLLLEAFQYLGDTTSVCSRLPSLGRRSVGTEYAPAVAIWKQNVPCRLNQ